MDSINNNFGEVLLWSFWFFVWISALMVWFTCLFDLFGDSSLGGWAKAGWVVVLIVLPWVGALIYLIARHRSMAERRNAAVAEQKRGLDRRIQEAAGSASTPADELTKAKTLLDSGVISQAEFDRLKTKVLA